MAAETPDAPEGLAVVVAKVEQALDQVKFEVCRYDNYGQMVMHLSADDAAAFRSALFHVGMLLAAAKRATVLERAVASLEDDERYLAAVKGRQEFRTAFKAERERSKAFEAERDAARAELAAAREQRDQLALQLAACLTAAECADCPEVAEGGYAWSLAFQKVRELRQQLEAAREALRPLADHAGAETGLDMLDRRNRPDTAVVQVELGYLRAARAALAAREKGADE